MGCAGSPHESRQPREITWSSYGAEACFLSAIRRSSREATKTSMPLTTGANWRGERAGAGGKVAVAASSGAWVAAPRIEDRVTQTDRTHARTARRTHHPARPAPATHRLGPRRRRLPPLLPLLPPILRVLRARGALLAAARQLRVRRRLRRRGALLFGLVGRRHLGLGPLQLGVEVALLRLEGSDEGLELPGAAVEARLGEVWGAGGGVG
jgi:hypothetical protein